MMPEKKHYSYTNLDDTPKHGEVIESSYLIAERGPKSTWTRITEVLILLATVGACAYLLIFLFHSGNNHQARHKAPAKPSRPVGASSSSVHDSALCSDNAACMEKSFQGLCCPDAENKYLPCCPSQPGH